MSLAPRLDLRQSQQLVMTPQLQQAIKLLALSNLEVEAFLADEIERNPLLSAEREGSAPERPAPAAPADAAELVERGAATGEAALDVDLSVEAFHHDSAADAPAGLDGALGLNGIGGGGGARFGDAGFDLDGIADDAPSLHDHLLDQAMLHLSGAELFVAQHLVDAIDPAGYVTAPLLEIANRLGMPLARVEGVLRVVQTFDPTGVGARTLAECLQLQAREADRYDPCMARLIDNLDLLARGAFAQLKRLCGVDDEDLADMIRELRAYDPKPGCRFGGERMTAVVPDLFVAPSGAGWAVELNAATLPRVLVDRGYYRTLTGTGCNKATRSWAGECLQNASWLVKALDQRQRTILKVAGEVVRHQDGFFRRGVGALRPLTLRQVADAVEMHESTVSRVTSNKYLACGRGTFELKYFFTTAITASDGGEAASAEAARGALKTLIAAEDAGRILSDDALVGLLRDRGFDLARRTVTKYREAMGIGSSVQRRRQRALAG